MGSRICDALCCVMWARGGEEREERKEETHTRVMKEHDMDYELWTWLMRGQQDIVVVKYQLGYAT